MTKFNLPTRRKTSAFTCLLLAIVMLLAGLFVSAPANAADPATVSVDSVGQTITYKHTFEVPVLFVVADARGTHNVNVPSGAAGQTESFDSTWGATANVRFLNPETELFVSLGGFALSSSPPSVPNNQTVTFCEATGTNTYALKTLTIDTFINGGYAENARTIAPSFTFFVNGSTATFPGLNWDAAGIAIFNNGCIVQVTTPTETAQPTPTVTPTTDPLPDDTNRKIGICHATHPRAEAYEFIEVSIAAILAGHGQHEGDIIPPVSYVEKGVAGGFAGNRWNEEGKAIFNNGCTVIPVHTPTPTVTETATPDPTNTETAKPAPSETETKSASPTPTQTQAVVPNSSAPSVSQGVIPVESKSAVASAKVSRYPAALVDTAVKGGGDPSTSPVALLLFGGAAVALLMALLLFRSSEPQGRRH